VAVAAEAAEAAEAAAAAATAATAAAAVGAALGTGARGGGLVLAAAPPSSGVAARTCPAAVPRTCPVTRPDRSLAGGPLASTLAGELRAVCEKTPSSSASSANGTRSGAAGGEGGAGEARRAGSDPAVGARPPLPPPPPPPLAVSASGFLGSAPSAPLGATVMRSLSGAGGGAAGGALLGREILKACVGYATVRAGRGDRAEGGGHAVRLERCVERRLWCTTGLQPRIAEGATLPNCLLEYRDATLRI